MANLQIKGMDDDFYAEIKELAGAENRSVSQQIIFITKQYLAKKKEVQSARTAAQTLLDLAGAWEDARTADEIIVELKQSRTNSAQVREVF